MGSEKHLVFVRFLFGVVRECGEDVGGNYISCLLKDKKNSLELVCMDLTSLLSPTLLVLMHSDVKNLGKL